MWLGSPVGCVGADRLTDLCGALLNFAFARSSGSFQCGKRGLNDTKFQVQICQEDLKEDAFSVLRRAMPKAVADRQTMCLKRFFRTLPC